MSIEGDGGVNLTADAGLAAADAGAPVISCAISLILYAHIPSPTQIIGIVAAISCVLILGRE